MKITDLLAEATFNKDGKLRKPTAKPVRQNGEFVLSNGVEVEWTKVFHRGGLANAVYTIHGPLDVPESIANEIASDIFHHHMSSQTRNCIVVKAEDGASVLAPYFKQIVSVSPEWTVNVYPSSSDVVIDHPPCHAGEADIDLGGAQ